MLKVKGRGALHACSSLQGSATQGRCRILARSKLLIGQYLDHRNHQIEWKLLAASNKLSKSLLRCNA